MRDSVLGRRTRRKSKKLIEAAAYWARGGDEPNANLDNARDDALRAGISPEDVELMFSEIDAEPPPQEGFDVYHDAFPTLMFFLRLSTQWQMAVGQTAAMRIGLRYEAVKAAMDMCMIPRADRAELFAHVAAMEHSALAVFAEKMQAESK